MTFRLLLTVLSLSSATAFLAGSCVSVSHCRHVGGLSQIPPLRKLTQMRLSHDSRIIILGPVGTEHVATVAKTTTEPSSKTEVSLLRTLASTKTTNLLMIGFFTASLVNVVINLLKGEKLTSGEDSIIHNDQEEKQLKIFTCEDCGYELMPARGRESKFFTADFKCPICGAGKEKFWNANDPDDPRNQDKEQPKSKKEDPTDGKKE